MGYLGLSLSLLLLNLPCAKVVSEFASEPSKTWRATADFKGDPEFRTRVYSHSFHWVHSRLGTSSEYRQEYRLSIDHLAREPYAEGWHANLNVGYTRLQQRLKEALEFVLEQYRRRNIISSDEIKKIIEEEESLPIVRKSYFEFEDIKTYQTVAFLRLFDGSVASQDYNLFSILPSVYRYPTFSLYDSRLPIERQFPHLRLPERKTGERIFEIGRVGVERGVMDDGLERFLVQFADVLDSYFSGRPEGVVYILATEAGAKLYQRRWGFRPIFHSAELRLRENETPKMILKLSVEELLEKARERGWQ